MVTIASNRFMAPVTEGYMKYFFSEEKKTEDRSVASSPQKIENNRLNSHTKSNSN